MAGKEEVLLLLVQPLLECIARLFVLRPLGQFRQQLPAGVVSRFGVEQCAEELRGLQLAADGFLHPSQLALDPQDADGRPVVAERGQLPLQPLLVLFFFLADVAQMGLDALVWPSPPGQPAEHRLVEVDGGAFERQALAQQFDDLVSMCRANLAHGDLLGASEGKVVTPTGVRTTTEAAPGSSQRTKDALFGPSV